MCVGRHIIDVTHLINLLSSFDFLGLGFGIENGINFLHARLFGLDIVDG